MSLGFALAKIIQAYRSLKYRSKENQPHLQDPPTISVCIPARNETHAMTECLENVLASDYPKMEVIVVDDNSTDDTLHLIKAFAHAGVRFVEGQAPPEGWLGKNYSLERLLGEASGRYVVFMDVDTRVKPTTISRLMAEVMADKKLEMVATLPQRYDTWRPSAWFSTLRCFWDLLFHSSKRPSAYSALWVVRRHLLQDIGGFKDWRDQIQPEIGIAEKINKSNGYKLIMSTPALGVSYAKKWSSQVSTARRALLPRFSNSIVRVAIGLGIIATVVLPQVVVICGLLTGWQDIFWGAIIIYLLYVLIFTLYSGLFWRSRIWLAPIVAPIIVWQEMWLLLSSVVGYQRGVISWKGRAISRPSS